MHVRALHGATWDWCYNASPTSPSSNLWVMTFCFAVIGQIDKSNVDVAHVELNLGLPASLAHKQTDGRAVLNSCSQADYICAILYG